MGLLDFATAQPSGGGLLDFAFSDPSARLGLSLLAASSPKLRGLGDVMAQQDLAKKDALQQQYIQSQIAENQTQNKLREQQMAKQNELQNFIAQKFGGAADQQRFNAGQTALTAGAALGDVGPTVTNSQRQASVVSQQPQAGFPLSFNDVVALKLKGGPDLMKEFQASQEGFKQEAGNYYINPANGQLTYRPKLDNGMTMQGDTVVPANGYAQANANIKGAEAGAVEAAKYPYTVGADRAKQTTAAGLDLVNVPMQDGSSRQMTRLQASGAAGAGGGQGGFGVTPSPVNQAAATGLNENWIKNGYQPTVDAGKAASDISASLQAIRNIDLNTGWGTEAKATAASVLTSLGIAPANASMFASNSQKFQSVAMDRLMTTLAAQKGPQTEGDAQRASNTFAQLKNTPEANKFIIDFAQAKANMDMRKAQFYEQALPLARKDGDLTRVDREWRKIQGSIWADPVLQQWAK